MLVLPFSAGGIEAPRHQTEVKSLIAANIATADEFADNTQAFVGESVGQNRVKEVIVNNLKRGYESFDLAVIQPILTNDFERRFLIRKNTVVLESKDEYLSARQGWKKSPAPVRELLYSIRGMETDETGKTIFVVAFSTYKTKYFNPRFLESLVFENIGEHWLLKRQIFIPLHPRKPDLYEVQIFVAREAWARDAGNKSSWSQYSGDGWVGEISPPTPRETKENRPLRKLFRELVVTKGADAIVDLHQHKAVKSLPYDEVISVLFVFREPPPIGAKIVTELIYERSYGDFPFRYEYTVEKIEPFFIIENLVRSDDEDGEFIMRVSIDGKMVAEKRVGA